MAKAFPLAGLLRLRHINQERAAGELAAANTRLRESTLRHHRALSALEESGVEISDPATLQTVAATRARARSTLSELVAAGDRHRVEAERAQTAFNTARAQTLGIEKLENRHINAAIAEELLAEQKVLDEISSTAWHRNSGERTP